MILSVCIYRNSHKNIINNKTNEILLIIDMIHEFFECWRQVIHDWNSINEALNKIRMLLVEFLVNAAFWLINCYKKKRERVPTRSMSLNIY
jgi:hypothetical protein